MKYKYIFLSVIFVLISVFHGNAQEATVLCNIHFNDNAKFNVGVDGAYGAYTESPDMPVVKTFSGNFESGGTLMALEPTQGALANCGSVGTLRFNNDADWAEIEFTKPVGRLTIYGRSGSSTTPMKMIVTCLKASDRSEIWSETIDLSTSNVCGSLDKEEASSEPCIIRIMREGATLRLYQIYAEGPAQASQEMNVPSGAGNLINVFSANTDKSVFYLEGPEYEFGAHNFSNAGVTPTRVITLIGAPGRTKITSADPLGIGANANLEFRFEGIDFVRDAGNHLFSVGNASTLKFSFIDCTFEGYARSFVRINNANIVVDEFIIDNCIFKGTPTTTDWPVLRADAASRLDNLVISNSTFFNIPAQIVRWNTYAGEMNVEVDNCTFYDVGDENAARTFLFDFNAATETSNITISDCIFAKGKSAEMQMVKAPNVTTVSTGNYKTSDFTLHETDNLIDLTECGKNSEEFFVAPAEGNFDIRDGNFAGTAGDPRWVVVGMALEDNEMVIPAGADLRTALGQGASADPPKTVYYLEGAEYTLSSSYNFPRDVYLIGAPGGTKIVTTEYFSVVGGTTYEKIHFKGIDFVRPSGTSHLFTSGSTVTYNLGSLVFEDCSFDGYPDAVIRGRATGVTIDEIIIDNCVFKNVSTANAVIYADNANLVNLSKLSIKNSTFAHIANPIARWILYAGEINVEVSNCTFYDVGGTTALFDFNAAAETSTITISDCIFAKGKQEAMLMVNAPKVTPTSTGNYRTSDFTLHTTDNLIDLTAYSGTSDDLFLAPSLNPFDFFLKDEDFAGKETAGDPRWMLADPVILTGTSSDENLGTVTPSLRAVERGTEVTVTANPAQSVEFVEWQIGEESITENPYTFTLNEDTEIVAIFNAVAVKVATSISPARSGKISITPDKADFIPGEELSILAEGVFGYRLKEWQIDGRVVTANPYTFNIIADMEVHAIFERFDEEPVVTPVTPADFVEKYNAAVDGEILLMGEGEYVAETNNLLPFPQEKIITLKAEPGKTVIFKGWIGGGNVTLTRGGIIFDGLEIIHTNSNDLIVGCPNGDIDVIAFRNCTLRRATLGVAGGRGIGIFNNAAQGKVIGLYEISNCIVRDIGGTGNSFFMTHHLVENIVIRNNTFFNSPTRALYATENNLPEDNPKSVTVTVENNTFYKWGTQEDEHALIRLYSRFEDRTLPQDEAQWACLARRIYDEASINIRNNVIAQPFSLIDTDNIPDPLAAAQRPPAIVLAPVATGEINAVNNLVLYHGDYMIRPTYENTANRYFYPDQPWINISQIVNDHAWATLFPEVAVPDVKHFFTHDGYKPDETDPEKKVFDPLLVDFTIDPASPLLSAGAGGGPIGDPRWLGFVAVESITLNETTLVLNEGEEATLTATVVPEDATFPDVTWNSSNENVATVEDGKVSAITQGRATIKATATDGSGVFAVCEVQVLGDGIPVTPETFVEAYQAAVSDLSENDVVFLMSEGEYTSPAYVAADPLTHLYFPPTKTITLQAEMDAHVTLRARFDALTPTSETADKAGGLIFDGLEIILSSNDLVMGASGNNIGNITVYAFRNCTIRKSELGGTSSQRGFGLFSHEDVYNRTLGLFEISNCIVRDIGTNNGNLLLACHWTKEIKIVNSTFWNSASQTIFMGLENGQTELVDGVKKDIKITVENNTFFRWGRFGTDEHGIIKIFGRIQQGTAGPGTHPISGETLASVTPNTGRKGYSEATISMRNNIFAQPENLNMALNPPVIGPFINGDDKVIANYTFYPNMLMSASVANTNLDASNNLVLYYGNDFNGSTGGYERVPTYPTATNRIWVEPTEREIKLNRTGTDLNWATLFPDIEKADVSHFFAHSGMVENPEYDPEIPGSVPTIYNHEFVDFTIDPSSPLASAGVGGVPVGDPRWVDASADVPVSRVVVEPEVLYLDVLKNTTGTLKATVYPLNATNPAIKWSSSDDAVATVNNGVVTAVGAGEVTITATSVENPEVKATCAVTVSADALPVSISLEPALMVIVGGEGTLTPSFVPDNATNKNVTWNSSNIAIATVDAGKVTGVSGGRVTITATTEVGVGGPKSATCEVTVVDVTLNKTTMEIAIPDTETLVATVSPSDLSQTVTWSSSNSNVATVDDAGLVTAKAVGTATITAISEVGGKTAECVVTVIQLVTGVSLNEAVLSVKVGETKKLTATVAPTTATNKNVTWESSDATIASIDNEGNVTGVKAGGPVFITVTTVDGGKTASCAVSVTGGTTSVEIADAPIASVYPNPTDGLITLEFDTQNVYQITIADLAGKVLMRQSVADQIVQLDLSSYTAGVYMLIIDDGKQQSIMRIVKN